MKKITIGLYGQMIWCQSGLSNAPVENKVKEVAWKHIDNCGHCGSCSGGRHKVIFRKEFNDVCGCTFRIDNPTSDVLFFLKKWWK